MVNELKLLLFPCQISSVSNVIRSWQARGKSGRNHPNEEFGPLLPTGIGERFSQAISNLGHAALLRRCELPL